MRTRAPRRALGTVLAVAIAGGLWPLVVAPLARAAAPQTTSPIDGYHPTGEPVDLELPEGDLGPGTVMGVLPDDELLMLGLHGLNRYDPRTGRRLAHGPIEEHRVDAAVLSEDGHRLFTVESLWSGPGSWVAQYDATTLAEVDRVALPGPCFPGDVALAGSRVWVPCNVTTLGFGSVPDDLDGPWEGLELEAVQGIQNPVMASLGDQAPVLLVGGNVPRVGVGDALLRLVLDGAQATVSEAIITEDRWQDEIYRLLPSPDHLWVLAGTAVYDVTTLEEVFRFPAERYDGFWGWHPDSNHLLGWVAEGTSAQELVLWSLGHTSPTSGAAFQVHFGEAYDGGVALPSADGERLYVFEDDGLVTVDLGSEPGRLSLDEPGSAGSGTVSGWLSLPDGSPPLAQPVTVERVGPLGALPVGIALADAEGRWTIVDPLGPPTAATTYRARWLGDLRHPLGAIALRLGSGSPPPSLLASVGPDVALPLRRMYPDEIVVDEVHGRAFVLGNVTTDAYDDLRMDARVDVYSLAGVAAPSLVLPGEPSDIELTADSTHLLVTLPELGRVDVLDAATLLRVGTITTAPLTRVPRVSQVIGDQLWIQDHGLSNPRAVPLADPMEGQRVELLSWLPSAGALVPDPARPGQALQAEVGAVYPQDLYRWDLTTDPPTRLQGVVLDPRPNRRTMVVPRVEGPMFEVWTHGIRALDRDTLTNGATRLDPERTPTWMGEWVTYAAPGPEADQVIALVSAPDDDDERKADSEVVVWDDRAAPYRRYDLGTEYAEALGAGRTGTVVATISATGTQEAAYTPPPMVLRLLRDPFGNGPTRPFVDLGHLVDRTIRDLLGVSVPEATTWFVEQLEQGAFSAGDMAAWLVAMSDPTRGTIERLYLVARKRFPTPSELAARERDLLGGRSWSSIATTIAGSTSAGRTALATAQSKAFVDGVAPFLEIELTYVGLLGRNATWDEIVQWAVARSNGTSAGALTEQLRYGAEYAQRIRSLPT